VPRPGPSGRTERGGRDRIAAVSTDLAEVRRLLFSLNHDIAGAETTLADLVGDLRGYRPEDLAALLAETQRLRLAGNFLGLSDTSTIEGDEVVADRVSIIIVTYGTGEILEECLAAIAEHTGDELADRISAYEVIVVDNPPADGRTRTAVRLRDRDDLRLIEAEENLGFAGANNLGMLHATGAMVCFMNPDVVVGPGWLAPLVVALDDPAVAVAAPVLVNPDGSHQEAGQRLLSDGSTHPLGVDESDRADYASAALWLVRRADHLGLGGFDQRYHPAYCEDVDYCLRVGAAGGRVVVCDVPVVHERGGGGAGGDVVLAQRSQTYLKARWAVELADRPAPGVR
jgi:hypothetical protein